MRGDVPLGIRMTRANTLREVDDNDFTILAADQQIEFVEVAMHKAGSGEADDERHKLGVKLAGSLM